MEAARLHRINTACLLICLVSISVGAFIGILGIWQVITTDQGILWRMLGTCGAIFAGAVLSSMALSCFKTNE